MSNAILDTFFEESEELLEALSEGLGAILAGERDPEVVNMVFRAVHSIKGGAGAFKLARLVAFAHQFETVLDAVRSNTVDLSPAVIGTLMRSADHLADLVEAARAQTEVAQDLTDGFLAALQTCMGDEEIASADAWDNFEFSALTIDLENVAEVGGEVAPSGGFAIMFKPHAALYSNGHEPALMFAALATLGVLTVTLDTSDLPDFEDFDPATPHLCWHLRLHTDEDETTIQSIFEFVHGLCDLDISIIAPIVPAVTPDPVAVDPLPEPPAAIAAPRPIAVDAFAPKTPPPKSDDRNPDGRSLDSRSPDGPAEAKGPKPTLRVDLERVDRLINTVGELIINQAMIAQRFSDMGLATDDDMVVHLEDYRLLARDIQEGVMAIRAQPVKSLFQRMSRIVREAADATQKTVELITIGEATEVDKTVVERLADPLTHMIRNSVDHGVEPPEVRIAAGKDPMGKIRLSAAHRSGSVVITVKDDGAGLNRPKILDIARRKGLVPADADLSDSEIDGLLFLPGFSTAQTVSSLSGRGVGLDVVRNAVSALGGRISIVSYPGQGTEFVITLPLTLAVMDGMVVTVSGQTLVVPITSIIETIRPTPADLHKVGLTETLLSIRGRLIPVVDVAQSLGFAPNAVPNAAPLLLIVETESLDECALVVDAVQDQRQVVIKSLEANFGAVPGVSAATVLGDGRIALILDPDAISGNRVNPFQMNRPESVNKGGVAHVNA